MQYTGGKALTISRHGMGDFWRKYLATSPVTRFVDVCCGSGSVAAFVGKERSDIELVCNDLHPAPVTLLRAVAQEGWEPPNLLTEDEYKDLQLRAKGGETTPLGSFAGYCCSFGGKYFGGYARRENYNYASSGAKVLKRDAPYLARAQFYVLDYAALPSKIGVREDDVWYVDKPYVGTTGYKGTPKFDEERFWAWASDMAARVRVLVSEFAAPEGWEEVWSTKRYVVLTGGRNAATTCRRDCVFMASTPSMGPT